MSRGSIWDEFAFHIGSAVIGGFVGKVVTRGQEAETAKLLGGLTYTDYWNNALPDVTCPKCSVVNPHFSYVGYCFSCGFNFISEVIP